MRQYIQKRYSSLILSFFIISIISIFYSNCSQPGQLILTEQSSIESPLTSPTTENPSSERNFKAHSDTIQVRSLNNKKVDVLIAIDNSKSMGNEQQQMASKFDGLLNELQGLDWRIGIVTTDVTTCIPSVTSTCAFTDGQLLEFNNTDSITSKSSYFWISSSMNPTYAKFLFSNTITRESEGSGAEQGIKAIYRAIERISLTTTQDNNNNLFFRDDAALSLIFVSDADESSTGFKNTPENLISLIRTKWPQKNLVANAIVVKPGDSFCLNEPVSNSIYKNESYGLTYQKLVQLTNGVLGSVCAPDYTEQLSFIGQTTNEITGYSIELNCMPQDINNDNKIDIEILDSSRQRITNYSLFQKKVTISQLPIGSYTINYYCLPSK